MITLQKEQSGFALLLTLVVVSVVLAIGLSLVDITLKQVTLSGTGRESEIAFHAAHAGAECAHFASLNNAPSDFTTAPPPSLNCFAGIVVSDSSSYSTVDTDVYLIQDVYDWSDTDADRCTQIDYYVFDAVTNSGDLVYDIPEYDPGVAEECKDNRYCTFILSRGYNRACADITTADRVVQREVLLSL